MLKEKTAAISGTARAIDLLMITFSFTIAAVTCQNATHIAFVRWLRGRFPVVEEAIHQYALLLLLGVFAWLVVTQWRKSYRSHRSEHLLTFLRGHITTQLLWVMSVGTLAFLFKLSYVSRTFFLTFLPLSMVTLTTRQVAARAFLHYFRAKGHNIRRVIVIGDFNRTSDFSRFIEKEGGPGYQIVTLPPNAKVSLNGNLQINFDEAFLTLGDAQTDLEETVLKLVKLGKRVHI